MKLAVSFTNFGPYHLARLRALAGRLSGDDGHLIAYETAAVEQKYSWSTQRRVEPFTWTTLFPGTALEHISRSSCVRAIWNALERDRPDAVAVSGYVRPEALAAAAWARRRGVPAVLMSESQSIDRPRVWWKETIKRRRIHRFDAALVGGPAHAEYLEFLGMPAERISFGYNAVDNAHFADGARSALENPDSRIGIPEVPYFLAVGRFVPEKNLVGLVRAYAAYRRAAEPGSAWALVLCGGGPEASELDAVIRAIRLTGVIHRPGFLQTEELPRWYAHASAFVLPSLSEPWGLVGNEAAACGLPLLVSDRAGCARTLVPEPPGTTGWQFDPTDHDDMTAALARMAGTSELERAAMGRQAAATVDRWGPDRFASGLLKAISLAAGAATSPNVRSMKIPA